MEKGKIMNIKNILLYLLLGVSSWSYCTTVGFEITWPKSALLMFSNVSTTSSYYHNHIPSSVLPQVSGYLATTDPLQMFLQRGMISGTNCLVNPAIAMWGWGRPAGWLGYNYDRSYPSRLIYMSDIVRAIEATNFGGNLSKYVHISGKEKGPLNAVQRGGWVGGGTITFNNMVVNALTNSWIGSNLKLNIAANNMNWDWFKSTAPQNLKNNLKNFLNRTLPGATTYGCNFMSLEPHATLSFYSTTSENPAVTEYFIKTGSADIYLPLHMISPGHSLTNPDPDYINYGPVYRGITSGAPEVTSSPSGFVPWNDGYYPTDIPNALMGSDF